MELKKDFLFSELGRVQAYINDIYGNDWCYKSAGIKTLRAIFVGLTSQELFSIDKC
jgi:hypothetical protein